MDHIYFLFSWLAISISNLAYNDCEISKSNNEWFSLVFNYDNGKKPINFVTYYGLENLKEYLESKPNQISFLDKYGKCDDVLFVHPGWINNNKFLIEDTKEIIQILKPYPPNSLDVIFLGTHGYAGNISLNEKLISVNDLFTDEEIEIINSKMNSDACFVFTGCNVACDFKTISNFSKKINHYVIAATSSVSNDLDTSLCDNGFWMLFNYQY